MADTNDLLSHTMLKETVAVNGRTTINHYDTASKTSTLTTPEGRIITRELDDKGRVVSSHVSGLATTYFSYDARGRLASVTQGSGVDSRVTSFVYDTDGFLESVTDPLSRLSSFDHDLVGRVIQQTLLESRFIDFAYDANGNLTSLTPPGSTAHDFSYTAVNQGGTYTPPAVTGITDSATYYTYNLDKQLTRVTRPV